MSENEIKPVAWVERTESGHDRMWSYSLESWANRPANPEPLYDQSAIDRLTADAASLRERMVEVERHLDDYVIREWRAERAKRKACEERDAAVADAARWKELCRQLDAGTFPSIVIDDAMAMGSGALELQVDAARAEGRA